MIDLEKEGIFVSMADIILESSLMVVFLILLVGAPMVIGIKDGKCKELTTELEQVSTKLSEVTACYNEYDIRLRKAADILINDSTETDSSEGALLLQAVDTIDDLTGILFPVKEYVETDSLTPLDASYLYNRSISR